MQNLPAVLAAIAAASTYRPHPVQAEAVKIQAAELTNDATAWFLRTVEQRISSRFGLDR